MTDMGDLDDITFTEVAAPSLTGAACKPRPHRHQWERVVVTEGGEQTYRGPLTCSRCGVVKDEARSRRGKSARQRGNAYERELAKKLGGKRTGMYGGPDDVTVSDLFVIQSKVRKAWPQWMADELAKLPRTGGRVPLLVVANAPGSSGRRKALVVVELGDWISLHGPTVPEAEADAIEEAHHA